ncbi:DnaB-like helicase C-terminal domain-containing protein [Inquilinus sp. OTU3971]|uniref:DnaB-like helicase C-terminal domain-containing protein n=1 Tax=Inquilinus sp. OTU3971 TaxID=3043855 RepID=UPI00313AEE3E
MSTAAVSKVYEFDETFQSKIAALVVRDTVFCQRSEGLVKPEFFLNQAEACLVNIGLSYYERYRKAPDRTVFVKLFKDALTDKRIPASIAPEARDKVVALFKTDVSDRDYIVDEVATFAKHQAVAEAIYNSVDLLEKRDFTKIEKSMRVALDTGSMGDFGAYDYFEEIASRTEERLDKLAGKAPPRGIPTGVRALDCELMHEGFGRKELTVFMGGPKSGKTMALVNFAKAASLQGYNVLYVTLEVAARIIGERLDASFSEVALKGLKDKIRDVESKILDLQKRAGALKIHEFPTGSMKPSDLRRLISFYQARGLMFDIVFVDYGDIMAPEFRTDNPIENSKSIYVDLRGIAVAENIAVVTATQTNREGAKAATAKMEHAAEDFNKVRIADLLVSINATDDERAMNEARLFFAASRNQAGNFTLRIKQDLEKAQFLIRVLAKE